MISTRTRAARWSVVLLLLISGLAVAGSAVAAGGGLIFDGNFETGVTPWLKGGGGVQCANYGTRSKPPRLRGTFALSTNAGQGSYSGEFTLPSESVYGSAYPLEACDLVTPHWSFTLPVDYYYGLMIWVPKGWAIPNRAFYGVNIDELHFINLVGSPVTLQLHPNHVTIALETGPCTTSGTPGCQWRSNADNSSCRNSSTHTCMPGYYAIPPGAFVQGQWNEVILGINWASNSSGEIQTWYRVKGAANWNQGSTVSGIPTVQWSASSGCCTSFYVDELEAYTAALTSPMSVWLDNDVVGTSFAAVAATMPGGVPGSGSGGGGGGAGGGGGGRGSAAPRLGGLRVSPGFFVLSGRRVARRCVRATRANRRHRSCTRMPRLRIAYRLNTPATVAFTITRLLPGRMAHGRCVAPARTHGRGRRCTRRQDVPGTLLAVGAAGQDAMLFAGRTDGRRLGPGTYLLVATPVATGGFGSPAQARFTLLR